MPSVKEVLQQFIPTGFMDIIQKTQQWRNLIQAIDKPNSPWSKLFDITEIFGSRVVSAWELLHLLEFLGVDTENTDLDVLTEFVIASYNLGIDFRKLNRFKPYDLYSKYKDELDTVFITTLVNKLRDSGLVAKDCLIRYPDRNYFIPKSKDTLRAIIKEFHGDELKYIPERRDCDDFAIMFKAFLSRNALGNLSVGIFWGHFSKKVQDHTRVFNHAVNVVFFKNGDDIEVELYEPQSEFSLITETNIYTDIEGYFVVI